MTETKIPDGVALTEVKITAMTPDVVAAVLKQITDAVVAAIPAGAIEKIAAEIISRGEIVRTERSGYGNGETKRYVLADAASKTCAELVDGLIKTQVEAYLAEDRVKAVIAEQVVDGMQNAIAGLPEFAARLAAERLGYTMMGKYDPVAMSTVARLDYVHDVLRKTQQVLFSKGIVASYEVPPA